jgi:zinc D-Ala-D-Ala dipeptidase
MTLDKLSYKRIEWIVLHGIFIVSVLLSPKCEKKEYFGEQVGKFPDFLSLSGVKTPVCYYDAIMQRNGLVDVLSVDPSLLIELKYATTDNFMHMNLYGCLQKAYLLPDVAKRLAICQQYLKQLHPEYSLVVYDAARPVQVQQAMWNSLDLPVHEKVKFLSNPRNGSLHNYGAAVDVSVIDNLGKILDMGTHFDDAGEEAYPVLENKMLREGRLTDEHIRNRELLRKVMRKGGFWGIQTEWWHFNAMTREYARNHYNLIM